MHLLISYTEFIYRVILHSSSDNRQRSSLPSYSSVLLKLCYTPNCATLLLCLLLLWAVWPAAAGSISLSTLTGVEGRENLHLEKVVFGIAPQSTSTSREVYC